MNIFIFGTTIAHGTLSHHSRVLRSLIEGTARQGHKVTFVASESPGESHNPDYCRVVECKDWRGFCREFGGDVCAASVVVVTSKFGPGAEAIDWVLDQGIRATAYYELDPHETLRAIDAEGDAPWLRRDQLAGFDIVFSLAGGPVLEAMKRHGAREVTALYEAIDAAVFHARAPQAELCSDLLMLANRCPGAVETCNEYLVKAARQLPGERFIIAGAGWKRTEPAWPANLEVWEAPGAPGRVDLYSSARMVLVPVADDSIEFAMPMELLEPAASGAACIAIDRPGLDLLFDVGTEVLTVSSPDQLVELVKSTSSERLMSIGRAAEKRVVADYTVLRRAVQFEQRLAKKFFGA
jgi:spore maturation protein CgeB